MCVYIYIIISPGLNAGRSPMSHRFLSIGEFPSYWDWLWCPGLSPVLHGVHRPSLHLPYLVFSIPSYLPLDFNRVSSLQPTYCHPVGIRSTLHLLTFRWASSLGTGSGTRCCGPRGGTAVRTEQKTRSKFLLWSG